MRIKKWIEAVMNAIFFVCGMVAILSVVLITVYMFVSGIPAIVEIGPINFLFGTVWKSTAKEPSFGILPFILTSVWGTLGAAMSCDVCIPYKKVHMRSAFFWMEGEELHMVPLHKDGFQVDDTPVEPGDEAVMSDGTILKVGELKLVLRLYDRSGALIVDEPYVTRARRSKAEQGRGDGLGAPGRGEIRREKKRLAKQKNNTEENMKKTRR